MFLPKIVGPDFYRLGEFFAVVASHLLLLRLCGNPNGSSTNLLRVLLLD